MPSAAMIYASLNAIFVLSLLFPTSCATKGSVRVEPANISINQLIAITRKALPVKVLKETQSGRNMVTAYFVFKKGKPVEVVSVAKRYSVEVRILGDRRPYTVEVVVPQEVRNPEGGYDVIRSDKGLARVIARLIQEGLHKRREDRNIVDDFRVF